MLGFTVIDMHLLASASRNLLSNSSIFMVVPDAVIRNPGNSSASSVLMATWRKQQNYPLVQPNSPFFFNFYREDTAWIDLGRCWPANEIVIAKGNTLINVSIGNSCARNLAATVT
jgi:hypothetical protein